MKAKEKMVNEMAVVEFDVNDIKKMCGGVSGEKLVETLTSIGAPCEIVDVEDENQSDRRDPPASSGVSPPHFVNGRKKLIIEITPNRPDFFFIEGIARAANMFLGKEKPREYVAKKSGIKMRVDKGVASVRPVVMAAIIKGVELDARGLEYLINAQEKLHETIGRKRKKIAIGIHDFDEIKTGTGAAGQGGMLEYKTVDERYSFIPLDTDQKMTIKEILSKYQKGKEYAHLVPGSEYPMITDTSGAISFPPIINSERTRLCEKTKNFFIDVTGTHAGTVSAALNMVVCALADRKGSIYSVDISGRETPNLNGTEMKLNCERISEILGVGLSEKERKGHLERMGYGTDRAGKTAIAAPYRIDVMDEVDVIEDIAIAHGYEKFEPKLPDFFTSGRTIGKIERKIDDALKGMGFMEIVSPILTSPGSVKSIGMKQSEDARVKNSKSEEYSIIRPSLALSVLECFARNKTKGLPQKFYEIGDRFCQGELERAVVFAVADRTTSFADIRGYAQTLFDEVDPGLKIENESSEQGSGLMDRKKSGVIAIGGEVRGRIGLVNEEILKQFNLQCKVAICEIVLD